MKRQTSLRDFLACDADVGCEVTMNNDLETQREYFEIALRQNPRDETVRFSLAQVLKDMGREEDANRIYDEGVAFADHAWFPKLIFFCGVSIGLSIALWLLGVKWIWPLVALACLGPILWLVIRRNRHHALPSVGFWQRKQTVNELDLRAEIERFTKNESQQ